MERAPQAAAGAAVRLQVGAADDQTLAAVLAEVSRHRPFDGFAFGLMVERLSEQLRHGANVLAIGDGQLLGYAGWLRVDPGAAEQWQRHGGPMPPAHWSGAAAIVTVTVARHPGLLAPILHAISHCCAGLPVYRMRAFQDGRPDLRRPPITGRSYRFP
ncbi:MAG: hypothetical protein V4754_21955 [Pseudomonadota bacterium]